MLRKLQIILLGFLILVGQLFSQEEASIDSSEEQLAKINNHTDKVEYLLKLAEKFSWSDVNTAEKYANQALQLSQKVNYEKGIGYANLQIAKIFADYEFDFSEKLVIRSLEYAKRANDSILMAKAFNLMGNLKVKFNDKEGAHYYYNMALQIYQDQNQDSLTASVYNNLGNLHGPFDEDSLSISYYKKAAEINNTNENYQWLAINYLNLAIDYMDVGMLEKGYTYVQLSLQITNQYNYKRLHSWLYSILFDYYFEKKEYETAIIYAKLTRENASEQNNRLQELEALKKLELVYVELEEEKTAYQYLQKADILKDTINKYNRLKELEILEMRYKFEEQTKQQKLENELLKAKHARKELIYILILVGSGLLLVVFVQLFFMMKVRIRKRILEKEKLAKELEHKNKELTTNLMYLLKKNEFISSVSEKLKSASISGNLSKPETIDRIIHELDRGATEDSWAEFEMRYQEVHVDFYNNLGKQFPQLTPNDLRICAFLRLNMTSKEIAEITYQSLDSLKMTRYRLRKKFNLSKEENLVSFLNQF